MRSFSPAGLAVNYDDVSLEAEKLRTGMTKADWVEIDFVFETAEITRSVWS